VFVRLSDDGDVKLPEGGSGPGWRVTARELGRRTGTRRLNRLAVLVVLSAVAGNLIVLGTAAGTGWLPAAGAGWAAAVLVMSVWSALVAGLAVRLLGRHGAELDEATARGVAAEAARTARRSARLAYFQALHDTVVTTLVAIARGGLDHRSLEVRRRCARDADYIRRLLLEDGPRTDSGLDQRLSEVVAAAEGMGLRVQYRHDPAPMSVPSVPPEVAEALGEATREALNNVLRHAHVSVCWVTVLGAGPTLTVRIVDRGRGFRPEATRGGFGLPMSITARMRAAGGVARVLSAPGEGTTVDLVWPT
jgi:signal transduction histidine kinase